MSISGIMISKNRIMRDCALFQVGAQCAQTIEARVVLDVAEGSQEKKDHIGNIDGIHGAVDVHGL